jgi:tetraacyldisaccharide 4'-kinase
VDILKWLLFPFSMVYWIITSVRNFFYDTGIFKSYSFKTPIICVGNLNVGGTGKSPMVEHLIKLYKNDYKLAVLSRGYKRTTIGFMEVKPEMSAKEVGDEPLQFKRKFNSIKVFVDANRKNALEQIEKNHPDVNLIILDDAYQHRRVKADISILLTTFVKPFYKDFILPVGMLRESIAGKKRADVIVVTKCPNQINSKKIEEMTRQINPTENQKVLFSNISYDKKVYSLTESAALENFNDFLLVTGIANPKPLIKYLSDKQKIFEHLKFPDHHNFTHKDIENLASSKKPILTTEKDFTRLHQDIKQNIYYLPIEIELNRNIKSLINLKPQ